MSAEVADVKVRTRYSMGSTISRTHLDTRQRRAAVERCAVAAKDITRITSSVGSADTAAIDDAV